MDRALATVQITVKAAKQISENRGRPIGLDT